MKWLESDVHPRFAALFAIRERDRYQLFSVIGADELLPGAIFSTNENPWGWIESNFGRLAKGELHTLPIIWRGEHFGLLTVVSASQGETFKEEQVLLKLALTYLAPFLPGKARRGSEINSYEETIARLRESEEKYRTFMEQLPAIVYVDLLDGQATAAYVSPQVESLLGVTVDEWMQEGLSGWMERIHPDDRERILTAYQGLIAAGQSYDVEYRMTIPNGRSLWIQDRGKVISGEHGDLLLYGVMMDVTERKLHERELEAEAMLVQAIGETLDIVPLLERLLNSLKHAVPVADKGSVVLVEPDGNLRIYALIGYEDTRLLGYSLVNGRGYASRAAHERRPLIISDIQADPDLCFESDFEESVEIQSAIVAPLMLQDHLLGVISLDSTSKSAFEETDLRLLVKFAATAAFILERARLFDETQVRLAESEALFDGGLELNNLLEPQSIGRSVVKILEQRMNWHHATVRIRRGNSDQLEVIGYGLSGLDEIDSKNEIERMNQTIHSVGKGMAGWVMQNGEAVFSNDLDGDPRYIETYPGMCSGVYAPIFIDGHVQGVISVESEASNAFDQHAVRFLSTLAAQAAGALKNSSLFRDMQKRLAELNVLHQSSQNLLVSGFDPEATYANLHEAVKRIMPSDVFVIVLAEGENGTDYRAVYRYDNGEYYPPTRVPYGKGLSGQVISNGLTLLVPDYAERSDVQAIHFGDAEHVRSLLAIPLRRGGRTFGMISVQAYEPSVYNESHRDVLETIAAQFASSIENARLFEETQQRLHELEILQVVSSALRQAHTAQEMLPIFVRYASRAVGAQAGSIYLLDEISNEWVSQGWVDVEGNWVVNAGELRHPSGEGITGLVGVRGEAYVIEDWRTEPNVSAFPSEAEYLKDLCSGISLPFHAERRVIGVMHIWYAARHDFTDSEKHLLTAIADMAGNALQRARLHEETTRQVQRLTVLRDMDRVITSSFDLRIVFSVLLNHVTEQLKVDAANVLLFNSYTNLLEYAAGRGFRSNLQSRLQVSMGASLTGQVVMNRQMVAIPDFALSEERLVNQKQLAEENFQAYYARPLIIKGELKGVLEVFHRSPLYVNPDWLNYFETLAGQAAIAIENARMFDSLERSNLDLMLAYDKTIEGWSKALDLRDRETEGHTRRVTDLTLRLAKQLGMNPPDIVHIRRGALLHDIGKIGIPDHILLKPGGLTEEEWIIMRQHPQYAYDMLSAVEYLRPALHIPYCHHEKWDGSGYPRGLKGEDIPLPARIFAIADVYDALTNHRPYRLAWVKEQALDYIRAQSGKHFDPKVVEAFMEIIEK